jgi:hypothetical protein
MSSACNTREKNEYCVQDTRAIQKVNSGELLIKQAMRKKLLYTKIHAYFSYFST